MENDWPPLEECPQYRLGVMDAALYTYPWEEDGYAFDFDSYYPPIPDDRPWLRRLLESTRNKVRPPYPERVVENCPICYPHVDPDSPGSAKVDNIGEHPVWDMDPFHILDHYYWPGTGEPLPSLVTPEQLESTKKFLQELRATRGYNVDSVPHPGLVTSCVFSKLNLMGDQDCPFSGRVTTLNYVETGLDCVIHHIRSKTGKYYKLGEVLKVIFTTPMFLVTFAAAAAPSAPREIFIAALKSMYPSRQTFIANFGCQTKSNPNILECLLMPDYDAPCETKPLQVTESQQNKKRKMNPTSILRPRSLMPTVTEKSVETVTELQQNRKRKWDLRPILQSSKSLIPTATERSFGILTELQQNRNQESIPLSSMFSMPNRNQKSIPMSSMFFMPLVTGPVPTAPMEKDWPPLEECPQYRFGLMNAALLRYPWEEDEYEFDFDSFHPPIPDEPPYLRKLLESTRNKVRPLYPEEAGENFEYCPICYPHVDVDLNSVHASPNAPTVKTFNIYIYPEIGDHPVWNMDPIPCPFHIIDHLYGPDEPVPSIVTPVQLESTKKFLKELRASRGYNVDSVPHPSLVTSPVFCKVNLNAEHNCPINGRITKLKYIENRLSCTIDHISSKTGKCYRLVEVLKVIYASPMYFVTFAAAPAPAASPETFATALEVVRRTQHEIVDISIRPKSDPNILECLLLPDYDAPCEIKPCKPPCKAMPRRLRNLALWGKITAGY